MSENVKELMERFYKVPEQTANEVKLYELARALRQDLAETQMVTLDALMEASVDCIGDAAEDGFRQGVRVCVNLMNEAFCGSN